MVYKIEYCRIHLTHDSVSVRKAHNTGWKHRSQVQIYYAGLSSDKIVNTISQIQGSYINDSKGNRKKGLKKLSKAMENYVTEKELELAKYKAREKEKRQKFGNLR